MNQNNYNLMNFSQESKAVGSRVFINENNSGMEFCSGVPVSNTFLTNLQQIVITLTNTNSKSMQKIERDK